MKRSAILLLLLVPVLAAAQAPPSAPAGRPRGQRGMMMRGQGIGGAITEITADGFTLKTPDAKTVKVKVTPDTRFRRERQPANFADFKVGDNVMVGGEPAGEGAWTARFVAFGGPMMMQMREGLGKQFIAGEVKAMDGTKLTVLRPDGETQTIEVDENTSFRKGRESITLPDIKVGDHVFGRGQLNTAGVFVPAVLNVGEPGRMRMGGQGSGSGQQPPPPR